MDVDASARAPTTTGMSYRKTQARGFRWRANAVVWLHMGARVYEAVALFVVRFSDRGRWVFRVRSGRQVKAEPRNVHPTLEAARRVRWAMWNPPWCWTPTVFDPSVLGESLDRKIVRLRDQERAAWTREPDFVPDERHEPRLTLSVDTAPSR